MRTSSQRFVILCLLAVLCGCSSKPSAQDILGVPSPTSARDIRISAKEGFFGGDSYLSASMSREDYATLAQQLSFAHRDDLLSYWPSALSAHDTAWWTVTSTNDVDTLFGEQASTYLVMRYENGGCFLRDMFTDNPTRAKVTAANAGERVQFRFAADILWPGMAEF